MKIILKKGFKLIIIYKTYFFTLIVIFIINLAETNIFAKKQDYKQGLNRTVNPSIIKIILILLTKIVAIYIKFLKIFI